MKKNTKLIIAGAAISAVIATLALLIANLAGGKLDAVGTQSATSLLAVLTASPTLITEDTENAGWSLTAPDGEARFIWSNGFSPSPRYDALIAFAAKPFFDAGLDVAKLPETYSVYNGVITVGTKFGQEKFAYSGNATPIDAYRQLVSHYPEALNYHASLDHFGIKLAGGNMFEWANDMAKNTTSTAVQDKDIVFVLNPEPLIAAGADPAKVQGWVYAQVQVMENNVSTLVYKFLKPFDIQ